MPRTARSHTACFWCFFIDFVPAKIDQPPGLWHRAHPDVVFAQVQSPFSVNSNRIRALFGSYIVDVLAQNDTQRVASLCSVHDGTHICRTLAVTRFHTPVPAVLADAHQRIRAGSSIGETLSGLGIETSKINDRWCQWPAGDYFSSLTGGTVSPNEAISLRLYTLRTRISERAIDYAVIAEAYHPAHFPVSDECQDRLSAHEQDVVDEQTLKTLCHILDQGL